jgi:hypothetical protein
MAVNFLSTPQRGAGAQISRSVSRIRLESLVPRWTDPHGFAGLSRGLSKGTERTQQLEGQFRDCYRWHYHAVLVIILVPGALHPNSFPVATASPSVTPFFIAWNVELQRAPTKSVGVSSCDDLPNMPTCTHLARSPLHSVPSSGLKPFISFLHADYRFKTSLQLAVDLAIIDWICCIINIQHLTDEFGSMP